MGTTSLPVSLVVRSVEVPDPGDLIRALPQPGLAWVRRGEGRVAWGEVARVETSGTGRFADAGQWWGEVCSRVEVREEIGIRSSGLAAFGSFAFSDDSASGGALVVPAYVLGRKGGRSWLTAISAAPSDPPLTPDTLLGRAAPPRPIGPIRLSENSSDDWTRVVRKAISRIGRGDVDKVVLARSVGATSDEPLDVRSILAALGRDYPMCWTFHVDGMIGATPELLARVDRGLVTSRVLAGTIRPTGDETADLAHAAALARSSKDREEHEYAVESITGVLDRLCTSINVPDAPSVMHLPNVMHLVTDVTGVLAKPTSSLELASSLHPSAAVCGSPTDAASSLIAELEDFDRGRYSGPVGWIDATGDGEWGIALRSAEIDPSLTRLRLFSGCGIVAASDPDDEWAESEAKLEPLMAALGLD